MDPRLNFHKPKRESFIPWGVRNRAFAKFRVSNRLEVFGFCKNLAVRLLTALPFRELHSTLPRCACLLFGLQTTDVQIRIVSFGRPAKSVRIIGKDHPHLL
jgi:hypothetical protein